MTADPGPADRAAELRTVVRRLPAEQTFEGEGFPVRRPFPVPGADNLDPFLLLDQMGPSDNAPGEAVGTGDHPHRGFETVTYLLEGGLEHRDSLGNEGRLGPGDTQWMTAGRGVVHREGPSEEIRRDGGRMHGVQLWVNLPRAEKMSPPAYQDIRGSDVAVVEVGPGAVARVIAGAAFGVTGPGSTRTPITYVHATLQPGAVASTPVEADHTALVYPLVGSVEVAGTVLGESELGLLGPGTEVELRGAGGAPAEVLLLTGRPLREPVARYGPFVMSTRAELIEAFEDFRTGRLAAPA